MKAQPLDVAYVAAATSWYGLIPVVVLMSLGFGRIDPVLSASGLLCVPRSDGDDAAPWSRLWLRGLCRRERQ